ncbi:MAG TPA: hypothetical protein VK788_10885 [Terriglobales bacterium]|jgi:hypothetical protein|nr:hypothetical protein [Terriglobales bacterium]
MSQEEIKTEHSGSKATPTHPRDIADLAALVAGHLTSHEPGEEAGTVMIFVWRDCAMMVKFPSGRRMYAPAGHGHTLDSTVHEFAVGAITDYCEGAGIAMAEIRVHMVPLELSTGEQIHAWLQALPGISITLMPGKEIGFGGPLPPAGEAG